MRRFAERGLVRLEGGASEVGGVLWQALEADEIGVLVANHLAFHEEVILLLHHLLENCRVERASHSNEQLGVLDIGREFIENAWVAAEGRVHVIKLLEVRLRCTLQLILNK